MNNNERLLNLKEYFHLIFIFSVFIFSIIFFDMNSEIERAQSILLVGFVSLVYTLQLDELETEYWNWRDEKKDTDYFIVAPFGLVMISLWIAYVDYHTPAVLSKYSGLLILFTLLSALNVNAKLKKRFNERYVSKTHFELHRRILWLFFLMVFTTIPYFEEYGTWTWDIPSIKDLFIQAFPKLFYVHY